MGKILSRVVAFTVETIETISAPLYIGSMLIIIKSIIIGLMIISLKRYLMSVVGIF